METILKGVTDSVKENIGHHISTRDLWLNVEHLYSTEGQERKDPTQDPVNIEGMTDSGLFLCKEHDCDISDNENENEEVCSLDKDHDSENNDEGVVDL